MHYCCKAINDCCDGCSKCCDSCCKECCDCCNYMCEGIAQCIGQCFSRPFSFCLFISFFVCFAPVILGIIGLSEASSITCSEPIKPHFIVLMIIYILNWLFMVYLCYRYGEPYKESSDPNRQERNVLQRTQNLILYDFVVCFYIFFLIFEIIWLIIGGIWDNDEPSNSPCSLTNAGQNLINYHKAAIIILWIYLAIGAFAFIMTIIIYACEEGSCTWLDTCRCMFLCCTCGLCDIGKGKKPIKQQRSYVDNNYNNNNIEYTGENQYYQERRQQYSSKRNEWLNTSLNLLGLFGWGKKKPQPQQDNQMQPVVVIQQQQPQNNPNMIILGQPQNQMYGNQQYPQYQQQGSGYQAGYQPRYQGGEPVEWRQQTYGQQGGVNYAPSQQSAPPQKKEQGVLDKAKVALNNLMKKTNQNQNQN